MKNSSFVLFLLSLADFPNDLEIYKTFARRFADFFPFASRTIIMMKFDFSFSFLPTVDL